MTKFIFDLDGTITIEETLPIISAYFQIEEEINEITKQTIEGTIPFVESFIKRVFILGKLPVNTINTLLSSVKIYPKIHKFIQDNQDNCIIATGNMGCWIESLTKKIGCKAYFSEGIVENNTIIKLTNILRKEKVVMHYKELGEKVVFIGDGNNDVEAMRKADISIASGLTHEPAKSVLTVADYVVYSEEALCRQLNQLY